MTWIRGGYCCRCGDCCRGDPYSNDPSDSRRSEAMQRAPPVEGMCPLFELHHGAPEGEGFCIGHEPPNQDPYYLSGCNVWPIDPTQIKNYKNCTYSFIWQD